MKSILKEREAGIYNASVARIVELLLFRRNEIKNAITTAAFLEK